MRRPAVALLALVLALPAGAPAGAGEMGPDPPAHRVDLRERSPGEWKGEFNRDLVWILGASGLDYASTKYALGSCARCTEGNPLHRWNIEISKAGTTALAAWGLWELRRRGHSKAASFARWFWVTVLVSVAGWNTWQAGK